MQKLMRETDNEKVNFEVVSFSMKRGRGSDINFASADELRSVRGIGGLADEIVRLRVQNGPYKTFEQMRRRVSGLGDRLILAIQNAGFECGESPQQPRSQPHACS